MATTPTETLALLTNWQEHRREADRLALLREFHPLAMRVANARCRVNRGMEVEDALQGARIGLMRAIDAFDPTQHTSLKAYIQRAMTTEINRTVLPVARAVTLPGYATNVFSDIAKARKALMAKGVPDPTSEQIAEHLGGISAERVERMQSAQVSSLDVPMGDDVKSASRLDWLPDNPLHRPDALLETEDAAVGIREAVARALSILGPRSQEILRLHLLEGMDATAVAERLGITRQAVSLSLVKALPRLRAALRRDPHVAEALS